MANRTRRSPLRRAAAILVGLIVVAAAALAAMVALGGPEAPPPMASVIEAARAARDGAPPPSRQHYTTQDGARVAYRHYPAAGKAPAATVAVLIHGSGGTSLAMNRLGHALAEAGIAAYAPDIRGHGGSGRRGDIAQVEELEEDLVNLVTTVVRDRHPDARLVLAGHSSGGGFALRMAAEDIGRLFSRFVLLAPYLGHDAPTTRPGSGGWVDAGVPRIIALSLLDRMGITALHHLPVLAFAVPPAADGQDDGLARTWSFTLWRGFGPGADPVADAQAVGAPVDILVGAEDEIMVARAYAPMFAQAGGGVSVKVLPGLDHMGLITEARGVAAAVRAIATD